MERTDKLIKVVGLLLFLAMFAYIGYGLWSGFTNRVQTALAVKTTVTISTPVSGIIVRQESVLTSSEPNLYISAGDGQLLSAGEVAAVAYSNEAALERAGRMHELELEISRVESALYGASEEDLAIQAEAVQQAVIDLSAAVARRELDQLDIRCLALGSLVFGDGADTATVEQLEQLKRELRSLQTNSTSDTRDITTDRSGMFTTLVDGWEQLSLDDVTSISPEGFSGLLEAEPQPPQAAYGKLISSYVWYYAAVVDPEHTPLLEEGGEVLLSIGRSGAQLEAEVYSLGPQDGDGGRVAVFMLRSGQAETLALRKATAELVFSEYSGVRIPVKALRRDEEGIYVYVMTGMQAEKKYVDLVYEDEEFCLAATGAGANSLREGNEMIVSAKDLYDGKVMD